MDEIYFNNFQHRLKAFLNSVFHFIYLYLCLYFNSLKYSLVTMKWVYVIGYHYCLFGIENEVRSIFRSFKGSLRTLFFNYGLWGSFTVF